MEDQKLAKPIYVNLDSMQKCNPINMNSSEVWILHERLKAGNYKKMADSGFCEHYILEVESIGETFRLEFWDGDLTFLKKEMY
jgi:hypothetical protein